MDTIFFTEAAEQTEQTKVAGNDTSATLRLFRNGVQK